MKKYTIAIVLTIAVFNTNAQTQALPKDWTCQPASEFNLKICFPQQWRFDDTTKGARFFIFTPSESDTDRFVQNFNLQASKLGDDEKSMTAKQYTDLNLKEIKNTLTEFKQASLKEVIIKGVKWSELIYTGKIESIPYKLKFVQRYTIYKGNAFVITYTSDAERKDIFYPVALKVLNTASL